MKELKGKVVVTGAASGIGRALAIRLAAEGARLALADTDVAGLEAVRRECRGAAAVETIEVDVSGREAVHGAANAVERAFGCVDVVVNNAGVSSSAPNRKTSSLRRGCEPLGPSSDVEQHLPEHREVARLHHDAENDQQGHRYALGFGDRLARDGLPGRRGVAFSSDGYRYLMTTTVRSSVCAATA
jgi:NAD(P)-dependent dehydrogenase (short-subunit alcohol dehydrogenase family)